MRHMEDLLESLFAQPSDAAARRFLTRKPCSPSDRRALSEVAGLEQAWINCDQAIPGNVHDLAGALIDELYEPFQFFRSSLVGSSRSRSSSSRSSNSRSSSSRSSSSSSSSSSLADGNAPRALFQKRRATGPLRGR